MLIEKSFNRRMYVVVEVVEWSRVEEQNFSNSVSFFSAIPLRQGSLLGGLAKEPDPRKPDLTLDEKMALPFVGIL